MSVPDRQRLHALLDQIIDSGKARTLAAVGTYLEVVMAGIGKEDAQIVDSLLRGITETMDFVRQHWDRPGQVDQESPHQPAS